MFHANEQQKPVLEGGEINAEVRPRWKGRELRFEGRLVLRFRRSARLLMLVLDAFEEAGWLAEIDDPLPPDRHLNQSAKERLRKVVHKLNQRQREARIYFYTCNDGEGIAWSPTPFNEKYADEK